MSDESSDHTAQPMDVDPTTDELDQNFLGIQLEDPPKRPPSGPTGNEPLTKSSKKTFRIVCAVEKEGVIIAEELVEFGGDDETLISELKKEIRKNEELKHVMYVDGEPVPIEALKWDPDPEKLRDLSSPLPKTYYECKDGDFLDSLATLTELGVNGVNTNSRRGGSPVVVIVKSTTDSISLRREENSLFKSVMVNGIEINENIFIFSTRDDVQKSFRDLIQRTSGGALWLLGAYGTGKTNVMKVLRERCFDNMVPVRIDLSLIPGNSFTESEDIFLQFVASRVIEEIAIYQRKPVESIDNIFNLKSNIHREKYPRILITIDESQDIYHKLGAESFNNILRYLTRNVEHVWAVCASSDYTVLGPCLSDTELIKSPFLKVLTIASYFSEDEIQLLLKQLVTETLYDQNIELIEKIKEDIWHRTYGHPAFSGFFLRQVYNILSTTRFDMSNLEELWESTKYKAYDIISQTHYVERIEHAVKKNPNFISRELFLKLGNEKIQYVDTNQEMNNLLRVSLAVLVPEDKEELESEPEDNIVVKTRKSILNMDLKKSFNLEKSCPMSEQYFYAFTDGRNLLPITDSRFLDINNSLVMHELILYIVQCISERNINEQRSYWNKNLLPSEFSYRREIYSILLNMSRKSKFVITFEEPIGYNNQHVDLCIIDQKSDFKYQIELAANINCRGENHTFQSHYIRQKKEYHKLRRTKESVVLCCINYGEDPYFYDQEKLKEMTDERYWPPPKTRVDDVKMYYLVQPTEVSKTRTKISPKQKKESTKVSRRKLLQIERLEWQNSSGEVETFDFH